MKTRRLIALLALLAVLSASSLSALAEDTGGVVSGGGSGTTPGGYVDVSIGIGVQPVTRRPNSSWRHWLIHRLGFCRRGWE